MITVCVERDGDAVRVEYPFESGAVLAAGEVRHAVPSDPEGCLVSPADEAAFPPGAVIDLHDGETRVASVIFVPNRHARG